MANPAREQAMALLLKGVQPEEVAAAIGVEVSYVLGLQEDPQFAATLRSKRAEDVAETYDKDSAINSLEVLTLSRLTDQLSVETDTNKLIRAFQVLNKADRRSEGDHKRQQGGTVVELHLPAHITQYQQLNMIKNHQGEVVEVGGRLLQTQDTKTVLERAAQQSPTIAKVLQDQEALESITVDDL